MGEKILLSNGGIVHSYPSFLSKEESDSLFSKIEKLEFIQPILNLYGKELKTPRLVTMMGGEGVKGIYYSKLNRNDWIPEIVSLKERLENMLNFEFDYVLINYYRDGKDHISYHSDREAIGKGKCIIASLSLGATRKFVMRNKNVIKGKAREKREFLLDNGYLIVMEGNDTQIHWEHTVTKTAKCNQPRINLTFRHS